MLIFIDGMVLNLQLLTALNVGTNSFKTQIICIKGNPHVHCISGEDVEGIQQGFILTHKGPLISAILAADCLVCFEMP